MVTELDEVMSERRHLLALAFRMLGTIADAEDAVQETYTRWYRLDNAERDAIESPRGWLTRVASRVCLDMLGSARARRERYVGPWLPEPLPAATFPAPAGVDPAARATLDDTVSSALLVVLETMTPAERVSFVLHDVFALPFDEIAEIVGRTPAACRQLAASARKRVAAGRRTEVDRAEHDRVVAAFAVAAGRGDLAALVGVLDANVELRSDGGGVVNAARRPVLGPDHVGRFVLGIAQNAGGFVTEQTVDGLGLLVFYEGRLYAVATLEVADGRVTHVRIVLNPQKLTFWRELPAP